MKISMCLINNGLEGHKNCLGDRYRRRMYKCENARYIYIHIYKCYSYTTSLVYPRLQRRGTFLGGQMIPLHVIT